jgi:hypothetical protein
MRTKWELYARDRQWNVLRQFGGVIAAEGIVGLSLSESNVRENISLYFKAIGMTPEFL